MEKTEQTPVRHGRVSVRRASVEDEPFILDLAPEIARSGPPPWRDQDDMASVDRRVISEALRDGLSGSEVHVAVDERGAVLGYVHVCEVEDYYSGACGHVADLVVAAEARGRGVGTTLLAAAEDWARRHGYPFLTLNVFATNEPARAVYEKVGFAADAVRYVKVLEPDRKEKL